MAFLTKRLEDIEASDASRITLGGKALKCYEMAKNGFPVPPAFVVSTLAYDTFVQDAGLLADMNAALGGNTLELRNALYNSRSSFNRMFSAFGREAFARRRSILANPALEEQIRNEVSARVIVQSVEARIRAGKIPQALVDEVTALVELYPPGTRFAVRSSGTYEDDALASFAGQYDTFLNRSSVEDILNAIVLCWASMWRPHVLEYRRTLMERQGDNFTKPPLPKMCVLVMQQIDSRSAGVLFTRNPLSGDVNQVVIESVWGQGEGLVGGECTPDRFIFSRVDQVEVSREISSFKTHMFRLSESHDGTEKVELSDESMKTGSSLSESDIGKLLTLASTIHTHYGRGQDVEWAIDYSGTLFVLQTRDITVAGAGENPSFEPRAGRIAPFYPPGPGPWVLDTAHFARPVSKWMIEIYAAQNVCIGPDPARSPFARGFETVGAGIYGLMIRDVNGFLYNQPVPVTDEDELMKRGGNAIKYWSEKVYLKELETFDTEWKAAQLAAHQKVIEILDAVDFATASNEELADVTAKAYDHAARCWQRHHDYTHLAIFVPADVLNHVKKWTGCSELDAYSVFENASPESKGPLNLEDPVVEAAIAAIRSYEPAYEMLMEWSDDVEAGSADAGEIWSVLCNSPNERVKLAMKAFRNRFGYRLMTSYDLISLTNLELPEFLVSALHTVLQPDAKEKEDKKEQYAIDAIAAMRARVPEDKRDEFDTLVRDGRNVYRVRDERGLATDLTGVGIARTILLRVAAALVARGLISRADLLPHASKDEALALVLGNAHDTAVSSVELERRAKYAGQTDASSVPKVLGPAMPPPPPPEGLPELVMRTFWASVGGVMRVFTAPEVSSKKTNVICGTSASRGVVQGRACVVRNPADDLPLVRKGDILVTLSTSAAFNSVIPMLSGIVADYGGLLSHAAIISRESNIPAVVSCGTAVERISTGMIIRVDGEAGEIEIIDDLGIRVDMAKVRRVEEDDNMLRKVSTSTYSK
ncbi:putative phosphoenolpyruvate synthase [Porphyridium purpureum]|uniref:Putative phosphoenolpyruvate synthase n=1 Tax=Porphyridium purpureum TaxID=35688 RepID=A0A5J4Z2Z1_PORPP|nr:putative phosphoenolpyruvate synthase [Porphyridium purpureum]|eukprot:POR0760..scf295_1